MLQDLDEAWPDHPHHLLDLTCSCVEQDCPKSGTHTSKDGPVGESRPGDPRRQRVSGFLANRLHAVVQQGTVWLGFERSNVKLTSRGPMQ